MCQAISRLSDTRHLLLSLSLAACHCKKVVLEHELSMKLRQEIMSENHASLKARIHQSCQQSFGTSLLGRRYPQISWEHDQQGSLMSQVQKALGCTKALAFDITAACSGFVIGVVTAAQFIRTGTYKNILVIGADALSRYVDWRDRGKVHKCSLVFQNMQSFYCSCEICTTASREKSSTGCLVRSIQFTSCEERSTSFLTIA